ncbi:MAG: hypothetical protein LBE83_04545, partial [Propionibacteriaceae bacterium]|nr:hypothetical protein [Propionibacteriaceae bacterium]
AQQAAYDAGLDGSQWLLDHFGVALTDFLIIQQDWQRPFQEMQQASAVNREHYDQELAKEAQCWWDYRDQKQQEYAERFAADLGGNIADDITF